MSLSAVKTARIDALLRAAVGEGGGGEGHVPGASVLARENGASVFCRSYGMADIEAGIRCTPATSFRLASVSKQFTAMAILMLAERGYLTLNSRLSDFFPAFPAWGAAVTIRHLLTHSSGLPDYEDFVADDAFGQVKDGDVAAILAQQSRSAARFAPGSQFSYSNSGYCLLAQIVESVTGQSFASFLAAALFAPLGMVHTVAFEDGVSTVPHRAYGYSPGANGGFRRTDQSATSATLGDGGIYSSVEDYARWDAALSTEILVSAAALEQMTTPRQAIAGAAHGYGYGWFIYSGGAGEPRRLEHDGTTIGFRNYVIRLPDQRRTILVLMNRGDGAAKTLARQIRALLD